MQIAVLIAADPSKVKHTAKVRLSFGTWRLNCLGNIDTKLRVALAVAESPDEAKIEEHTNDRLIHVETFASMWLIIEEPGTTKCLSIYAERI